VPDQGWGSLPDELAADVRRVTDRLAGMSAAKLAGMLPPSEDGMPPYWSRAQATRVVAELMADAADTLERGRDRGTGRAIPALADFAAADQLAVTGHDLLAALDLRTPDEEVADAGALGWLPARDVVTKAARFLADLRRRL
jgi:hypothetical protein